MDVLPTPNRHVNLDVSTYLLECQPGGFQSLLQNGLISYPAIQSNPITERASSSLIGKTVIDIDDGEEVRKEQRLSWMPDEDVRLVPKKVAVRWLWTLLLLELPQEKHLLSIL
ncbi:hypothetical protein GQ55_5G402600 [Panicum hallii var. hallii]|uniref:Uncharacterized protein n=1 Tax=Panicum hallii var. hallii TaxID=1504633 RepID=A0A2T7DNJ6_9POAL|nr:hypothetical protein GQ55_5G402600 [Panicum hallii var. hallii]